MYFLRKFELFWIIWIIIQNDLKFWIWIIKTIYQILYMILHAKYNRALSQEFMHWNPKVIFTWSTLAIQAVLISVQFSSVQFSHSVMSNSLRPHGLQHIRFLCPSPTPRVYSNSCPLSRWCHPTISFCVIPFSCLQSFPASGSFPISQFFASGGQSIGVSASASVLPMNIQDWFPLGWTGWISLQSKGLSRVFSNTTVQKHQFFRHSAFFIVQLSHPYMTTGKTIALTRSTFVGKVMSLLLNMLSRLVITSFQGVSIF